MSSPAQALSQTSQTSTLNAPAPAPSQTHPISQSHSDTHDFSPIARTATSQSQNPLYPSLSRSSTVSVENEPLPPAACGHQFTPEERAAILAARRGEQVQAPQTKPKGFAKLFSAFRHPKTAASTSNTFGKWSVNSGGGYGGRQGGNNATYGGLM